MDERVLRDLVRYTRFREKELRITRGRERVKFLARNPLSCTEEDLDMLSDMVASDRKFLFKKQPDLKQQYEEFRDTPEKIASSLFTFMRRAWRHAGVSDSFRSNWHHAILCEAFEGLATGAIPRLIINISPGMTKSLLAGVFFQAWRWAIEPSESFLYGSYSEEIPTRTSSELLTLIGSSWYQRRWGHKFRIVKDSERTIRNNKGGWRIARGAGGGGTGEHPLYVLIDDPQKGVSINQPKKMMAAIEWYATTLSSRGFLKQSRHAIIMQRLAINDMCGVLLGETTAEDISLDKSVRSGWHHVCLPMHFDPEHPYRFSGDPRTVKGQLMWPEMITEERVQRLKSDMELSGQPNADAQLEQNPRLAGGKLFGDVSGSIITPDLLPKTIRSGRCVRAWDRAGTDRAGDYTVGVLAVDLNGVLYILDVQRFQLNPEDRDEVIVACAKRDASMFPNYRVANEIMPGPDGKSVQTSLAKRLMKEVGVSCTGCPASRDKVTRATPVASMFKNGIARILGGKSWNFFYTQELANFPFASHDDCVDSTAHAQWALSRWEDGQV